MSCYRTSLIITNKEISNDSVHFDPTEAFPNYFYKNCYQYMSRKAKLPQYNIFDVSRF